MTEHTDMVDAKPTDDSRCSDCPLTRNRRAFLRDVALAAAAALTAAGMLRPGVAFAESAADIDALPTSGTAMERSYPLPRMDGVSVDARNDVMLVRWEQRVYAFSLKCPHKGARLEWRDGEQRVFCPKHKARFLANGTHVSGRGSRDLDRYPVRVAGGSVVVDLGRVLRADQDASAWSAAVAVVD